MKWRKITDLTDEEVKELVFDILEVKKENTNNIERDEDSQEITVDITTTWDGGDEPDFDITDNITLYLYDIDVPFGNPNEYTLEYKKWLFAHGVCSLAYNNKFLKKGGIAF